MRRRLLLLPAAALSVALLAGCSSGGADSSRGSAGGVQHGSAPQGAPDLSVSEEAPGADGAVDGAARSVVTTGSLSITAEDPVDVADQIVTLVTGAGGRIDSRSVQPTTDVQSASANLVLRVPSDSLDGVLADVADLGDLDSVSTTDDDVTQQTTDLDARIEALGTSVDRLQALLAQATTTADLIEIESALSSRQAELDSLTAQQTALSDQVEYATISVYVASPGTIPSSGPADFWGGLTAGWSALVAFVGAAVVVVGVLLPWLAVLAVVGAIVFGAVRVSRRRARRRADAVGEAPGGAEVVPEAAAAPEPERHA